LDSKPGEQRRNFGMSNSRLKSPPLLLAHRLTCSSPSLGCNLAFGMLLTGLASLAFVLLRRHPEEEDAWIIYGMAGIFAIFGLLILWSWFRQMIIPRGSRPLVEVSMEPWVIGQGVKMALVQPGPARLKSLRSNLICLQQDIQYKDGRGSSGRRRHVAEKIVSTETLIEAWHLRVTHGDQWHEIREITLPRDSPPSKVSASQVIRWRIEVWGKGRGLGSFMDVYDITVLTEQEAEAHRRLQAEEEADEE
jgi:hypothetical protein